LEESVVADVLDLGFQQTASLVAVDRSEAGINSFDGVTSIAQVKLENTAFLKPDGRAAGVS